MVSLPISQLITLLSKMVQQLEKILSKVKERKVLNLLREHRNHRRQQHPPFQNFQGRKVQATFPVHPPHHSQLQGLIRIQKVQNPVRQASVQSFKLPLRIDQTLKAKIAARWPSNLLCLQTEGVSVEFCPQNRRDWRPSSRLP